MNVLIIENSLINDTAQDRNYILTSILKGKIFSLTAWIDFSKEIVKNDFYFNGE